MIGWSEKTMLNLTDGYVAAVDHKGDVAYGFVDAFMRAAEDRGAVVRGSLVSRFSCKSPNRGEHHAILTASRPSSNQSKHLSS